MCIMCPIFRIIKSFVFHRIIDVSVDAADDKVVSSDHHQFLRNDEQQDVQSKRNLLTCPATYAACSSRPTLMQSTAFNTQVVDLQCLLNTLNRAGLATDGYFGSFTNTAVRAWQTKKGLQVDGIVGCNTWQTLCGGGLSCESRACKYEVTAGRQGIVKLLTDLSASGNKITYSQVLSKRWSGIQSWTCPANNKVPAYADCSSFVSWVFWSMYGLGEDKLNGKAWKEGYTGTMGILGVQVSKATTVRGKKIPASYAKAQPGDIVLYGPGTHSHVAIYIGNGMVASFGSTGPVKMLSINYHSDKVEQIRSFIGNDSKQFGDLIFV